MVANGQFVEKKKGRNQSTYTQLILELLFSSHTLEYLFEQKKLFGFTEPLVCSVPVPEYQFEEAQNTREAG